MRHVELLDVFILESKLRDDWEYDHNTTMMLAIAEDLKGMLKAAQFVTERWTKMEKLDTMALLNALAEVVIWMQENIVGVEFKEDN